MCLWRWRGGPWDVEGRGRLAVLGCEEGEEEEWQRQVREGGEAEPLEVELGPWVCEGKDRGFMRGVIEGLYFVFMCGMLCVCCLVLSSLSGFLPVLSVPGGCGVSRVWVV